MSAMRAFFDKVDEKLDAWGSFLGRKNIRYNPNVVGSLCFIVIAVVFLLLMPSEIAVQEENTINARTFPKLLFHMILALSCVIFLLEMGKIALHRETERKTMNLLVEVRTLIILGLLVGYLLLLRPLGFILSSILFGMGMVCYFRVRAWHYYLIVGVSAILIGVLFQSVLHVRLP